MLKIIRMDRIYHIISQSTLLFAICFLKSLRKKVLLQLKLARFDEMEIDFFLSGRNNKNILAYKKNIM